MRYKPYIHATYTTVGIFILEMCLDKSSDTQQWMVRQNSWWSLKLGSVGEHCDELCPASEHRCLFSCPQGWGWLCVPPTAGELAWTMDGDGSDPWCLSKEWFGLERTFKGPCSPPLPCSGSSSTKSGCSEAHPSWIWSLAPPLWPICAGVLPPSLLKLFSYIWIDSLFV